MTESDAWLACLDAYLASLSASERDTMTCTRAASVALVARCLRTERALAELRDAVHAQDVALAALREQLDALRGK